MRVLLVFCEGPHDIYFASRSLCRNAEYRPYKGVANDLPRPFGWKAQDKLDKQLGIVVTQAQRLDSFDMDLDRLNFGKKPLFEHALHSKDKTDWALFVNMGSDSAAEEVVKLLRNIKAGQVGLGDAKPRIACAFVFDADFKVDSRGLDWRIQRFIDDYTEALHLPEKVEPGSWWGTILGPVGLWVHYHTDSKEGTLEDFAGPIFSAHPSWKGLLEAAGSYIDDNSEQAAPVRVKRDKRWKASITIAGQLRPDSRGKGTLAGSGMNVVIKSGLEDDAFDAPICKMLADFLIKVPWPTP
jgi:hypothetical protein